VICINRFLDDQQQDLDQILGACRDLGVPAEITDYREAGGKGGLGLAQCVVDACHTGSEFRPLYDLKMGLKEKVEVLAERIYGADGVNFSSDAESQLNQITNLGFAGLPVCVAKTPASLSDDPKLSGRPEGFRLTVQGARVSAGAGFVVIYTGKIMTMPGLPKRPAAQNIDIDPSGTISGLF
jgi:formate--tetrahydrofolate ligase